MNKEDEKLISLKNIKYISLFPGYIVNTLKVVNNIKKYKRNFKMLINFFI